MRLRNFLCKLLRCQSSNSPAQETEPAGVRGFNICAVYILGKLYENFPDPHTFRMHEEVVRAAVNHVSQNGPVGDSLLAKYISPTMNWLARNGYVDAGAQTLAGHHSDVQLTEKAFKALGTVPVSIRRAVDERKSLGDLMREAAVSQGATLCANLVKQLLAIAGAAAVA